MLFHNKKTGPDWVTLNGAEGKIFINIEEVSGVFEKTYKGENDGCHIKIFGDTVRLMNSYEEVCGLIIQSKKLREVS